MLFLEGTYIPIKKWGRGLKAKKLEEIELLRKEMVKIALAFGINHPSVLKMSQKLDELHNELLKIELLEKTVKYKDKNEDIKLFEENFSLKYA